MEKIYSDTSYTIGQLISYIETGSIAVPDLQREYVWKPSDIRDLLDSMYKGYPIGYLLLWESQGKEDDSRYIGVDEKSSRHNYLIIDGQQRLTSLYAIMTGKEIKVKGNKKIKIAFNPLTEKFDVQNASIERNPEWIADISDLYLASSMYSFIGNYIEKVNDSRLKKEEPELLPEEKEKLEHTINDLINLRGYHIGTLTINRDVDEEKVADIFTRVNSGGVKLTENDFILTLISVNDPDLRDDIEHFCEDNKQAVIKLMNLEPKHIIRIAMAYIFKRGRLKYAYQVLRGIELKRGSTKIEDEEAKRNAFADLREGLENVLNIENWNQFEKAIISAGYLNETNITSTNALIASYILYLIGKYDFGVNNNLLRNLIARWFYIMVLRGTYTNSFETTVQEQLNELIELEKNENSFRDYINRKLRLSSTDDYFEQILPEELSTSSTNSPAWNAYLAALSVMDVKALFSDLKVSLLFSGNLDGTKKSVERHHLFPKEYLHSIGIDDDKDTNQIANYAYIEWPDNIDISDDPPNVYFPKMVSLFVPEDRISELETIHALPDKWYELDYKEFLNQRRKLMATVIKNGYETLTNKNYIEE